MESILNINWKGKIVMGKRILLAGIFWAMLWVAAGTANGAEVAFDRARLILNVPEKWDMSEETATLVLPDSASVLHFILLQSGDHELMAARREVREIRKKDFSDVDSPEGEELTINGMKAAFFHGSIEGKKMDFYEVYLLTPVSRLLCIYYTVSPDSPEIQNEILGFINNIKPKE